MDYKKIFSPETLQKLNKKSAENLKTMLGDKNLIQTLQSSQQLLSEIIEAEAPYKSQLEKLAVDMVQELYPIIEEEGIVLDAKLVGMSDINKSLDEIKVNNPSKDIFPIKVNSYEELIKKSKILIKHGFHWINDPEINSEDYSKEMFPGSILGSRQKELILYPGTYPKESYKIDESISPEGRRRIINSITQGSALRGTFAFYLFKEHLDEIDPSLVEKYNQIMKEVFGIYDDPNGVAMLLSLLAQGHKAAGGSSKVIIKEIKVNNPNIQSYIKAAISFIDELRIDDGEENKEYYDSLENKIKKSTSKEEIYNHFWEDFYFKDDTEGLEDCKEYIEKKANPSKIQEQEQSGITIKARAICFPMLVHELIKGLYELVSLQGFKGDKAANQAVVDKVDRLEHEPQDIAFGKFIYDALNDLFAKSKYNNPKIREFFFTEVYKLDDEEFISLIENAINESLTGEQSKWVESTLKSIDDDLKADEFDKTGIDEIKINNPVSPEQVALSKFRQDLSQKIGKPVEKLNLKLGKYNISGDEVGIELNYNEGEKYLSGATKKNVNKLFNQILGVQPQKLYIGIVPRKERDWDAEEDDDVKKYKYEKYAKSYYIYGEYNGVPIVISRKETAAAGAGQSYVVSALKKDKLTQTVGDNYNKPKSKKEIIKTFGLGEIKEQKLLEYSEKTITTTIDRWKKENPKVDDNVARQVIQRFDQIKGSLAQKLNIVSLSDELKKNNNFLNIDKYTFDDMVKLIKSLPENPEKVKKDAIQKFVDKEEIDKPLAQSYVARFMTKRDALKQGVEDGIEELGLDKKEVLSYIPKFLQQNNAFLDPRNWKWHDFEQMLDALFPTQRTVADGDSNDATTDADKVYNKNGIEVYKGDDVHKCISYNPTVDKTKRKKYGWCVTQPGNTNYDYYRFQDRAPTFYIVFDRNKTSEPEHSPFKDPFHAFVVQVNADGKSYVITAADNRGDNEAKTWEGVQKIVPSDTWARIKDLKDVFKPIKLSAVERGRKFASGKSLSLDEFKELDQDEKILYIQGKASKNAISNEIKEILPDYKISLEGRSTTLANVAIDSGQKFSWNELKKNESLAKRYAIFRFRHTNYSKDPLPLPFIKYLDEEGKAKYLKIFEENLNFNLIEKFFGEKQAEAYANEEAAKLQYLPEKAVKYIKDNKLKKMYSIYLKLTDSWNFSDNFKLDEESISKLTDMPVQDVTPVPINEEQWKKLSTQEREFIVNLASKVNANDKYSTLLYALPYIVKDGDKSYALLPKDNKDFTYDKWVLMDVNGKVIKDNISGDATLGDNTLITGYPSDNEKINRIYDIKDLKGDKLKEIKVNNPNLKSPLEIKSQEHWDKICPFLKQKGYKWEDNSELKSSDFKEFIRINPYLKLSSRKDKKLVVGDEEKITIWSKEGIFENKPFNIPNPDYYQKLLNISNGLSPSTAKYFQDVLNSVKKQNGKATEKQWRILQRLKTGDFNLSTKN